MTHYLIVGCGLSGITCARILAERGNKITIIDKSPHIGGAARDYYDDHGVLVHSGGPHIFHTNSDRIWNWICRFTSWNNYVHTVLAKHNEQYYPIPINRITINRFFNLELSPQQAEEYMSTLVHNRIVQSSEDVVLNSVGSELCEAFFSSYTRKQWGYDLSDMLPGVAARIPVRYNDDCRYFTDKYQGLPSDGYTKMFECMLDHDNISVHTAVSWSDWHERYEKLIWTGPIDEYYNWCYGELPYRSMRFEFVHHANVDKLLPAPVVNHSDITSPYTRVTEYKTLTQQRHDGTTISYEYPCFDGDKHYPIPTNDNTVLAKKYFDLADKETSVSFVGRLGRYRYYNMDQVIGQAMTLCDKLL